MRKIKKTLAVSIALMLAATIYPSNGYVKAAEANENEISVIEEEVKEDIIEETDTEETDLENAVSEDIVDNDIEEDEEVVAVNYTDKIAITEANFPDENFRKYLRANREGRRYDEIEDIYCGNLNISSLKGIELFPNLEILHCQENNLTRLDVSKNTNLTSLWCFDNKLTSIDVSKNSKLTGLECGGNNLSNLDVSKNPKLLSLGCGSIGLTKLDISNNPELYSLGCNDNNFTSLDVSNNPRLNDICCENNNLTSLDVSKNTALWELYCSGNKITSLDVRNCISLRHLDCSNNNLNSLDVSKNMWLMDLYCSENNITNLDVSNNLELYNLDCSGNKLSKLDVSMLTYKLADLYCTDNNLTTLYVNNNKNLSFLVCDNNKLTSVDVSNNPRLERLSCDGNSIKTLDVSKNYKLRYISCNNTNISALNLSNNPCLEYIYCKNNSLTNLDVSKNPELSELVIYGNNIKEIDLNNNQLLGGYVGTEYGNTPEEKVEIYGKVQVDRTTILSISDAKNIISSNASVAKLSGTKIIPQKTNKYSASSDVSYTLNGNNVSYELVVIDQAAEQITNLGYNITVATRDKIQASLTCTYSNKAVLEYSFYATQTPDNPSSCEMIKDWNSSNTLNWTPSIYGDYTILGKIRVAGKPDTEVTITFEYAYHPSIKGNCQMPYAMVAPGEGGYLIGLETYEKSADSVEMLILDCTTMQWTYSTGKNPVPENMLWTIWQPQYGYYWTLFRVYDKNGTIIDQVCYGFVNAY